MFTFFLGLQHGVGQNQNSRKKQLHEGGGTGSSSHGSHSKAAFPPGSRLQQPFFDTLIDPDTGQGGRNVTTAEGGKALLFCTIRSLGDNNTVSQTLFYDLTRDAIANKSVIDVYCRCLQISYQITFFYKV